MLEVFRCADCGEVFSEPEYRVFRQDVNGDGWAWETIYERHCPNCWSDAVYEHEEDEDDA